MAFFSLYFREIDVQVADGLVLELLFRRALPVFVQRQAADAVALETVVQRRARQVRNRSLQGVEAVVQCQQRVPTEGHDDGFQLGAEHRRNWLWAPACIPHAGAQSHLGT